MSGVVLFSISKWSCFRLTLATPRSEYHLRQMGRRPGGTVAAIGYAHAHGCRSLGRHDNDFSPVRTLRLNHGPALVGEVKAARYLTNLEVGLPGQLIAVDESKSGTSGLEPPLAVERKNRHWWSFFPAGQIPDAHRRAASLRYDSEKRSLGSIFRIQGILIKPR